MEHFDATWLLGNSVTSDGITVSVGFEKDPMQFPRSREFRLEMSRGFITYKTIIHADRDGLDTKDKAREHLDGWVSHFRNLMNCKR